jgi:uncharacterized protein
MIGLLTLYLQLPGCASLKEKRGRIKPLIARLHREFNVSVAEMEKNDAWGEAVIACALVSNDHAHTQRSMATIARWVEANWPDMTLFDEKVEIV